jgi:hypothetical protein
LAGTCYFAAWLEPLTSPRRVNECNRDFSPSNVARVRNLQPADNSEFQELGKLGCISRTWLKTRRSPD